MPNAKRVILCVDDDPDILEFLRIVIEANNYTVCQATSAEEGLQAYRETSPDLIICDLMMEEVDAGTNLVKELKALGNKAPVYMLSSTGDHLHNTVDAGELGLSGILQKPFDSESLLALLRAKLA
jgi:DNA-binding response OmpR family regulator